MIVCKSSRTFSISYNIYYIFKANSCTRTYGNNSKRIIVARRLWCAPAASAAPTRTEARGDRRDRREGVKINKYKHI